MNLDLTWMLVLAEVMVNLMTYFPFKEAGTQCIWPRLGQVRT